MPKPKNRIEEKGDRVLLFGTFYAQMKRKLRELANNQCERCGKFTMQGDVEHITIRGMGAAKRDDRIFVNGKRNLLYLCRTCHSGRHIPDKVVPAKPTESEFDALLGLGEEA